MATSPEIAWELAERLIKAKTAKSRQKIIRTYQRTTGKSATALYRIAKENGWESGRTKRHDDGVIKAISGEQVLKLENIIHQGRNKVGKYTLPTTVAVDLAETSGVIEPGQVSPSTVNRVMRQRKTDRRSAEEPTPHITMQSLYPNHVHLFDVTHCAQYHFDGRILKTVNIEKEYYKNKPQLVKKMKKHLYRYVLTDHTSGNLYVDYFWAAGENTADAVQFLLDAWSEKNDEHLPFHGVPEILIQDKGSALNSQIVLNLLKNLNVEIITHLPGNPRAKGSVENAMSIWEKQFESRLIFDRPKDLEEIRTWCRDFLVHYNATAIHSRTGMTRTAGWLNIRHEQLRRLPPREICQRLAHSAPKDCMVYPSLVVRYKGEQYSVRHIPGIHPRDKIPVQYDPFSYPSILVEFDDRKYLIDPIQMTEFGFPVDAPVIGQEFKSHKETVTQKGLKAAADADPGEIKALGFHRERLGNVTYMHRDGDELELPEENYQVPGISRAKACIRIAEILGRHITREENRVIAERYGSSVPEDMITTLAEEFSQGITKVEIGKGVTL